ncbi:hypothetical protein [Blautia hansenii]|uniref:hypothetical protein n=1 Tax=Blautia hansenii TaxID=1322 RepID=UPI0039844B54
MERLTHKRVSGIKEGYWSPNKKQELVDRLAAYENTGLTPEQVQRLKEKSTARKLIEHETKFASIFECPSCGCIDVYGQKNCDECGQKLDWSE